MATSSGVDLHSNEEQRPQRHPARTGPRPMPAGVMIGLGMGGFVDGILLHQIAQWHNTPSNVIPPHTMDAMRVNMRWVGLFHAFT